jgi:hypothetical protein
MLRFGERQRGVPGRPRCPPGPGIPPSLAVDFFVSLLHTVDDWAERTLAEIAKWYDLSPDGKNDRGLEIFANLQVPIPAEHNR